MNTVYNGFDELSSSLANFFLEISPHISKPQASNLAYFIIASTEANSIITSNVASHFKGKLSFNKPASNVRRIQRFLNNDNFDIYSFFNDLTNHVFTNFKVKHPDKNVFVCMDHTHNNDDFVTLVITVKIGKQSVPVYFETFLEDDEDAYSTDTLRKALNRANELFPDYNIIFLCDRWFNDPAIFKIIEDLSDYYCIRTKTNITISKNSIDFISLSDINPYVYHSKLLEDIYFTRTQKHKVNIAISPSKDTEDPWYIVTNLDPKRAIKYYAYRFGGIEFCFKHQKTNGYFLEKTTTRNLSVFTKLFGITCISILWLTILGSDYCKNKNHLKFNLYDVRTIEGKKVRVKSLFRIGKEIFTIAYNSFQNIKIKTNFVLYDV